MKDSSDKRSCVSHKRGLTLIELLVTVSVVAILAGLAFTGFTSAMSSARRTAEVSAAKQLMVAYLAYPADNHGKLLPGVTKEIAYDSNGNQQPSYIGKRWPLRLGPYFDYRYVDLVMVNEQKSVYENAGSPFAAEYMASVSPTFGLNTTYAGGNHMPHFSEPRADKDPTIAVTRMNQAYNASELIVFVSARLNQTTLGNFYVLAPNSSSARWSGGDFDENASARSFGHVHPRWNGKAVAACLDGSVQILNEDELRDMRRWSNQAAKANDPNWTN